MSLNVDSELYLAFKSGKVVLGAKKVIKLLKTGKSHKLVILGSNAPTPLKEEITYLTKLANVPLLEYQGKSIDLGRAFKRPFFVSAAAILDPGESRIMEII